MSSNYGLDSKIIKRTNVINRVDLLRAITAFEGEPSRARSSENKIFEEERFECLLADLDIELTTIAYFMLQAIEEANKKRKEQGLPTVTAGKYALLAATAKIWNDQQSRDVPVQEQTAEIVSKVMNKWSEFQNHIKVLSRNERYDRPDGFNFDGYYKGFNGCLGIYWHTIGNERKKSLYSDTVTMRMNAVVSIHLLEAV